MWGYQRERWSYKNVIGGSYDIAAGRSGCVSRGSSPKYALRPDVAVKTTFSYYFEASWFVWARWYVMLVETNSPLEPHTHGAGMSIMILREFLCQFNG